MRNVDWFCHTARAVFGLLVVAVAPAMAQYSPPADPAVGEDYHVEVGYGFWNPEPSLLVNSEALGILGTDVDLVDDLGIEKKRLGKLNVVLRPGTKHRFRFEYLPIKYETDSVPVQREFIFNGQRYRVGLPVSTLADFKTYRIGYEYDFIYRNRGFFGVLFDVKYTDVNVELNSVIGNEFTTAVAPIPTLGLVGRVYPVKNLAIGGEVSMLRIPENLSDDYDGRYTDFDLYGTLNFTKNVGATVGYRSVDVFYRLDNDSGTLTFKGLYLNGVVRF